jgi:hypothetical protein
MRGPYSKDLRERAVKALAGGQTCRAVAKTFTIMIGTFVLFFAALRAAGVDMSGQSEPLKELQAGVSGYVGWANRALFAATYLWAVLTSVAVV